jgi:hypothetical protein
LNLLVLKRNIKSFKKSAKLPYGQNVTIHFDEDSFTETTVETETKVKYSSVEKIAFSNIALYIYVSSVQAFIIPYCVFENEGQ